MPRNFRGIFIIKIIMATDSQIILKNNNLYQIQS